jgi:hypothetical protein
MPTTSIKARGAGPGNKEQIRQQKKGRKKSLNNCVTGLANWLVVQNKKAKRSYFYFS